MERHLIAVQEGEAQEITLQHVLPGQKVHFESEKGVSCTFIWD